MKSHDGGRTFETIINTLREDLGYDVHHTVIDARGVVPQHHERTYIVGFREPTPFEFPSVGLNGNRPKLASILDSEPDPKFTLSLKLWEYLQGYAAKHKAKGNGFGFGLVDPSDPDVTTRTLSARDLPPIALPLIISDSRPVEAWA